MDSARAFIETVAESNGTYTESRIRAAEEHAARGYPGWLHSIHNTGNLQSNLENSLAIIARDLYTTNSRFLMEVIQNADDAQFPDSGSKAPMFRITITPRHIQLECNETGFTEENIKALCSVGKSSKPPGQGYTGQKGIGFKSVFKIAKRAHIRSDPYYFVLDDDKPLGIITPQWDEEYFKNLPAEYQTTIVLDHIRSDVENFSETLEKDVTEIHSMIVLFLRRLQRLEIVFVSNDTMRASRITKCFKLEDESASWPGVISVQDEYSKQKDYFYKAQYVAKFEGHETRRPGVTTTEIILAFPIELDSGKWLPKPSSLPTYAYLPLAEFGFKFVIQADFLTTSNRQSIDENSAWNKNLAEEIPQAFVKTIQSFNRLFDGPKQLGKTWPLFLSDSFFGQHSLWSNVKAGIVQRLKATAVIQTRAGTYAAPSTLMFMDWAHDHNDEPIFGSRSDYVSSGYDEAVRVNLMSLGVSSPNAGWVLCQLQMLSRIRMLHSHTQAWHSDLARVILSPAEARAGSWYVAELRCIPLIPLSDGSWSGAPTPAAPIFFPASLGTQIPSGLALTLVQQAACESPSRKRLFAVLGVQDCDVDNIVRQIFDYHARSVQANRIDVIGHVRYLYEARHRWQNLNMKNIWFAGTPFGTFKKANELYADKAADEEIRNLFAGYEHASFLAPEYVQNLNDTQRSEFVRWLKDNAGIATMPRLRASNGGVHADFLWLLNKRRDRVLDILQRYWTSYSSQERDAIKRELALCEFRCKSGASVALHKTFLPLASLEATTQRYIDADRCSFLELPIDISGNWNFLSQFGVGTKEDLDFFLWILKQPGFAAPPTIAKAKELYLQIQSHAKYNVGKVRATFRQNVIVSAEGTLVSASGCVYHAPSSFTSKPSLFRIYGEELSGLFGRTLNIPFATSAEVLGHLQQLRLRPRTTIADVVNVYDYLARYCANSCTIESSLACIAVPSSSGHLEWKKPVECVWDDQDFSQNELEIRTKVVMQRVVSSSYPTWADDTVLSFFTKVLRLPNAGIDELLDELRLMQREQSDDTTVIHKSYEVMQKYYLRAADKIRSAFSTNPLVHLRRAGSHRSQWLDLHQCIWTRSILRNRYPLSSALSIYKTLFVDVLRVPMVTAGMLATELVEESRKTAASDAVAFQYCKDLLLEISSRSGTTSNLHQLDTARCWPCRSSGQVPVFRAMGEFYVNDRSVFFDIFSDSQTFLDLEFAHSQRISAFLRRQGCVAFLSGMVTVSTDAQEPDEKDDESTRNFQRRAPALNSFFEYSRCRSPDKLKTILETVEVRTTQSIVTNYQLKGLTQDLGVFTETRKEGDSCVRVTHDESNVPALKIYFSTNQRKRHFALATAFPKQLISALSIDGTDIISELTQFFILPVESLESLLIYMGISGGNISSPDDEGSWTEEAEEELYDQNAGLNGLFAITSSENRGGGSADTAPELVRAQRFAMDSALAAVRFSLRQNPTQSATQTNPISQSQTQYPIEQDQNDRPSVQQRPEAPVGNPVAVSSIYNETHRFTNTARLELFAQTTILQSHVHAQSLRARNSETLSGTAFDLSPLASALPEIAPVTVSSGRARVARPHAQRARNLPERSQSEQDRDFEVGFLGEYFVFQFLQGLNLPNFSAEENWTSSLRNRAGFAVYGQRETSDFTYHDVDGKLTSHLQQMLAPAATPQWLNTVNSAEGRPTYHLEVKSTTNPNHNTAFYVSGNQYALAKNMKVSSATPPQIYAILRVSGLNALDGQYSQQPEIRVYLDPYALGETGELDFYAPVYTVTAQR